MAPRRSTRAAARSASSPAADVRDVTAPAAARVAGALLLMALGGLAVARADPRGEAACGDLGGQPVLTARFLLGAARGDGGFVGETAWRRFLDRSVTPRFPDGLSAFSGQGRWRSPGGRQLREPTRLLLIVVPDTPQTRDALHAVRADYARLFAQTSVGLLLDRSCAAF